MNCIKLVKLKFEIMLNEKLHLPQFFGNTIRGIIGKALSELYCDYDKVGCDKCNKKYECVYSNVFKSGFETEFISDAPNPFTIDFETTKNIYDIGEIFSFSIVLFGNSIRFISEICEAVIYSAKNGLGERSCKGFVKTITDVYNDTVIYEQGGKTKAVSVMTWTDNEITGIDVNHIKLKFITPFLYSNMNTTDFSFRVFMDKLFGRIADIYDVYGDDEFVLPYNMAVRKSNISTQFELKKVIVKQKKINYEALTGEIDFCGQLNRYLPYISLGSELHFGKLATRGFGKYIMEVDL